ncbi:hypothetical protein [Nocardia flavorosea]|uniref:hypothetical protein n=1 Tax=Nocardia flavorosea TaxID=53429 RepID=UPI0024556641|nr:hypothetical protein [Nocardia flavorosea]
MRSYTTAKCVTVTVGDKFTDIYRDGGVRVLLVVEIADPWTDRQGRERCSVLYRVVSRDGKAVSTSRVQEIDAARLTDPKLYARVGA